MQTDAPVLAGPATAPPNDKPAHGGYPDSEDMLAGRLMVRVPLVVTRNGETIRIEPSFDGARIRVSVVNDVENNVIDFPRELLPWVHWCLSALQGWRA